LQQGSAFAGPMARAASFVVSGLQKRVSPRRGESSMPADDPKRIFPSPQLSDYANIIQPARKTKRKIEMSKRFEGATVSSLFCGEV